MSAYHGAHRADDDYPAIFRRLPLALLCLLSVALLVLALSGCNVVPGASASQPKASPPAVRTVTVAGDTLGVAALFSTDKTRQHGLQDTTLLPRTAAVFTWDGNAVQTPFWMIHTPEALSLLWVRAGKVVGHVEMARCSLSCPTYNAPAVYDTAVEAPAGTFAGVKAGTAVTFS